MLSAHPTSALKAADTRGEFPPDIHVNHVGSYQPLSLASETLKVRPLPASPDRLFW